mmetsp:Transcript_36801/g.103837  ORF Transcript_36801/g.103837 Transcript_36801/m.103837 type:complete len:302 (-) Transcript_36801:1214-2119(-)
MVCKLRVLRLHDEEPRGLPPVAGVAEAHRDGGLGLLAAVWQKHAGFGVDVQGQVGVRRHARLEPHRLLALSGEPQRQLAHLPNPGLHHQFAVEVGLEGLELDLEAPPPAGLLRDDEVNHTRKHLVGSEDNVELEVVFHGAEGSVDRLDSQGGVYCQAVLCRCLDLKAKDVLGGDPAEAAEADLKGSLQRGAGLGLVPEDGSRGRGLRHAKQRERHHDGLALGGDVHRKLGQRLEVPQVRRGEAQRNAQLTVRWHHHPCRLPVQGHKQPRQQRLRGAWGRADAQAHGDRLSCGISPHELRGD